MYMYVRIILHVCINVHVRAFHALQTEKTFLRLEGQSFFTEVMVTVTPHTLWVKSTASQSRTSIFHSPPRGKSCVYMYYICTYMYILCVYASTICTHVHVHLLNYANTCIHTLQST